jgi:hypothetical protein
MLARYITTEIKWNELSKNRILENRHYFWDPFVRPRFWNWNADIARHGHYDTRTLEYLIKVKPIQTFCKGDTLPYSIHRDGTPKTTFFEVM